jgi:hypothetical protein
MSSVTPSVLSEGVTMRTRLLAVATAAFLLLPLTAATAGASDEKCDDQVGVEHSCDEQSRG